MPLVTAGIYVLVVLTTTCPQQSIIYKQYQPDFQSERRCLLEIENFKIHSPHYIYKCIELRGA